MLISLSPGNIQNPQALTEIESGSVLDDLQSQDLDCYIITIGAIYRVALFRSFGGPFPAVMASLFAENIFFSAFIEFEKVITYYLHIIPDSCDISELRHFFFKQRVQLVRQIIR